MSRLARQRRSRRTRRSPASIILGGLVALLAVAVLIIAGTGAFVLHVASEVRKLADRRAIVSGASSQIFAAGGQSLGFIQSDVLRTPVRADQIPAYLRDATVAIEDQRFYRNDGIDITGIFRS